MVTVAVSVTVGISVGVDDGVIFETGSGFSLGGGRREVGVNLDGVVRCVEQKRVVKIGGGARDF